MNKPHKLEILLAWLEDNILMETDIQFDEGIDSEAMLPAVRAAVGLLNMPRAERFPPPWNAYAVCEAFPSEELSEEEARVWNSAQKYVQDTLRGRTGDEGITPALHRRSSH